MARSLDLRHLLIATLIGSGLGLLGASATGIASLDDAIRAAEPVPSVPVVDPGTPNHLDRPEV